MYLRVATAKKNRVRVYGGKEPKVKESGCGRAVREFCKDTTLHGFKYLVSENYYDRVGWLLCCGASACCAGALCCALWARFLQVPALLTLHELRASHRMPRLAVCPSAETVAHYALSHLSIPENVTDRLPIILSHVLRRKKTNDEHLLILEDILVKNNLTLPEALMRVTPPCHKIVLNCRWQIYMMPCEVLFKKELTDWGACCVSRPYDLNIDKGIASRMEVTRRLSVAVQCSDQSAFNGCEFYTQYVGEECAHPTPLSPGHNYFAHLSFGSVVDGAPANIVGGTCVGSADYSRNRCLLECRERQCGCREPLRNESGAADTLPPCLVTQLGCLRTYDFEQNVSCNCLPACKKVFTYMALESSAMDALEYTNDKIYSGINATISSVLRIVVRMSESRLFVVHPTETWITLLSSLGGVFNMFLGVGFFSALEVLYLLFVRLPIAIRKSTNIANSET